ncbi:MAG: alanine--tRNA ligase, partial [Halocynthiibacter sp.]
TEIFYDHGDHIWGGPPGSPEEDGDRFIEIWNLVFMQFEQFEGGERKNLPKPSIDTGMGLERIAALLQGSHDNYDTDLFKSLIEASAHVTGVDPYGDKNVHHRVIADHLRSTSFLIADGVLPSNEGRGYVLRRIMRRAMRHAHMLGAQDPVMHKLVPSLVTQMGQHFTELGHAQSMIEETLLLEETRFRKTLDRGLRLLDDELDKLGDGQALPGAAAFKLYDTYGFPLDLTQDALREKGLTVETGGFEAAMEEQKNKARAAWVGSGDTANAAIWFDIAKDNGTTDFLGYDSETAEGQIVSIVKDGAILDKADTGEKVQIALNQTPFYAESGGQVGDAGVIKTATGEARITDVQKSAGVFMHVAEVTKGVIETGVGAELIVDHTRRTAIRANHSATHLLNEALRNVLGDHVVQRGSLNAADRLRFDFSHSKAVEADEMKAVEAEINALIRQNGRVETRVMTPDDARDMGAQALFGEKYGDEVRVVSMGIAEGSGKGLDGTTYSLELCGGTHVNQLGEIGACVLLSDAASASGVRRIEALTGEAAMAHLSNQEARITHLAGLMKAKPHEVVARVEGLMDERKSLQKEIAQLKQDLAMASAGAIDPKDVNGTAFVAQVLSGVGGKDLMALIDQYKGQIGSGAILLMSDNDGKVAIATGVTKDLTDTLSAVDMVKAAAEKLGGKGGGGRPEMAQAGGKDIAGAEDAIAAVEGVIAG